MLIVVFKSFFLLQAVYIAPLKALVRERMDDWKVRFEQKLGRRYYFKSKIDCVVMIKVYSQILLVM